MKVVVAGNIDIKNILVYTFVSIILFSIIAIPAFFLPDYIDIISVLYTAIMLVITIQLYICMLNGLKQVRKDKDPVQWTMVSIIIPCYNEEKVLPRSLDSMLDIDYPKECIEFLYVYEAKDIDATEKLLIKGSQKDSRIKPIKRDEELGGKAAAANFGIKQSKGSIVACYDADHSLSKNSVKNAVRTLFADSKVVCVKGRYRTINKNEGILAKISGIERDIADTLIWYGHDKLGGFTSMGGNAFFKRDIFDILGYFHENTLTEDVDYSLKIYEAGYDIRVNPNVVSWEESPASFTQWWHQRIRWARGWIQSSLLHLQNVVVSPKMSLIRKSDTLIVLLLTLIQPIMLLYYPLYLAMPYIGFAINYSPPSVFFMIGGLLSMSSVFATIIVLIKDYKNGEAFRWDEILYLPIMGVYLTFLLLISWIGFIEEFVLKNKYNFLKTDRSGTVSLEQII